MKRRAMLQKAAAWLAIACMSLAIFPVRAPAAQEPALTGQTAILCEVGTGRILYEKDADKRMYPASMTKILTALTAFDYWKPDEFITLGSEINEVPAGSSKANHAVGETLTFENLLRGLMIRSGNESGCAIAFHTAKKMPGGKENMTYAEAERIFCAKMNEKAKSLGATDTNFTNPHGYHDNNHYTTANDILKISLEFMKVPLLREIVSEKLFEGNGAGDSPPEGAYTKNYYWESHNELLLNNDWFYESATGIKTGFTDEAGNCLAASATKDGMELISVVFFSPAPSVWEDSMALLDYGFNNFSYRKIQRDGDPMGEESILRPRLGAAEKVEVYAQGEHEWLYSEEEVNSITRALVYDESYLASAAELPEGMPEGEVWLKAPISKGSQIGKAVYTLNGSAIFEAPLIAADDVEARTFGSDVNYYWERFRSLAFTAQAMKYWIAGGVVAAVIIVLLVRRALRPRRRNRYGSYRRY
jgi:D-alanyl-D-alanine carboxypeptidase (penicillin-binding protein 5/6)